ncbi:MAG TPA: response regulator [Kiritimatiellia bacterium]|nr:response regulator [Kiritimatiellia bacterium]
MSDFKAPRLLIVDDSITVRMMATHYLGEAGYDVETLDRGAEVVSTVSRTQPDAILLDVILPDASGFDVCRALRGLEGFEHAPILIMTTLDDEQAIVQAFEAGASEFISKPLNWHHEAYRIRYLLRASANLRELDEARQKVVQAEREWEMTFNAIDDPLYVFDLGMTIRNANVAAGRAVGMEVGNLIGRCCGTEEDGKPLMVDVETVKRALAARCAVRAEVRDLGAALRDCLVSAAPVFDGQQQITSVVYGIKDVTEYRELQREVLHAQKMESLGVLASGVAHDFNNLLQGITGWADLLRLRTPSPECIQEGLKDISSVAEKGRVLARQLLFTSRKEEAKVAPVNVGGILVEVASILSRTFPKTITIETFVDEELPLLLGDESRLHQAVMNLGVNGGQAMPEGGTLCLHANVVTLDRTYLLAHPESREGRHVVISVSDTGMGIPQADLAKIFDPFFTTKETGKGTGLGLSIVFGVVKDHGGYIHCYSEENQGTTFRIYLPVEALTGPVSEVAETRPPRVRGTGISRRILIAEDDPMIGGLLQRILTIHGHQVTQTFNGQEALECFASRPGEFDAILLDMNMPVMSGWDCLQGIRSKDSEVVVILASGALFPRDRLEEIKQLANDVVLKPFHERELLEALEAAFDSGSAKGPAPVN